MQKILLNGEWNLASEDGKERCVGSVPSCNYLDLFKAGIIEDPILGNNEETLQWVSKKTWEYSRKFSLTKEEINNPNIRLVFEQIDTLSTIYINGEEVGKTASAHALYELDIKEKVRAGENEIKVVFHPPFELIEKLQKEYKLPLRVVGERGNPHLRYPQYHFGWDWGPHFVSCGMTRDVYILAYQNRIADVTIEQTHANSKVELRILTKTENDTTKGNTEEKENSFRYDNFKCVFEGEIVTPSGECLPVVFEGNTGSVFIDNPKIWWCNGLGNQPLYQVKIRLKSGNIVVDEDIKNIGLRTIVLSREKDAVGNDFCFIINGERIFARGANWIPTDIFINRTTSETLELLVKAAKDANMNMLRVWGGGYYERNEFYDLCDKYGLLVWQDLMFACTPFQWGRKDFYDLTIKELEDNVKRLRHRASLALWCGNNEIESISTDWRQYMKELVSDMEKYFYEDIPARLKELDRVTPYWPTSPGSGTFMEGMDKDNIGDTHIWAVWHGLQKPEYYNKRKTRFCSEFGMQSMPSLNAIDIFAPGGDYDLKSHTMLLHQKCLSGNKKMKYYMNQMLWEPEKKEHFVYFTQVVQSECMETATIGWRLMKGVCNGALIWQLNDCWGVNSWAGIDYYNNFKALHYRTKHFDAPLAAFPVIEGNDVVIKGINDTLSDAEVTLKYYVGDVNLEKCIEKTQKTIISKGQVVDLAILDNSVYKLNENSYVLVTLSDKEGNELMRKGIFLSKKASRKLLIDDITYEIKKDGNKATISLYTPIYKRFVSLRIKGETKPFSDNFFDMYPGEKRTIEIETELNVEEIKEGFSVISVSDVRPGYSKLHDRIEMMKIFFIPLNFLSYIYHTFMI